MYQFIFGFDTIKIFTKKRKMKRPRVQVFMLVSHEINAHSENTERLNTEKSIVQHSVVLMQS